MRDGDHARGRQSVGFAPKIKLIGLQENKLLRNDMPSGIVPRDMENILR
jgi:hypothetical protein